jgi:serine protease
MTYSITSKQMFKKASIGVVVLSLFACGGELPNNSANKSKLEQANTVVSTEVLGFSDEGVSNGVNLIANSQEHLAALKEAEDTYKTIAATQSNVDGFIIHYKSSVNSLPSVAKPADVGSKQLASASLIQYNQASKSLGLVLQPTSNVLNSGTELRLNKAITLDQASELTNKLIATDSRIESIEPNVLFQSSALVLGQAVADQKYLNQWGLSQFSETFATTGKSYGTNPQNAWTKTTGETIANTNTGAPVVVAVLDTGKKEHEDLAGQYLPGYDFISNSIKSKDGNGRDPDPTDLGESYDKWLCGPNNKKAVTTNSWHGTKVASVIAALMNNSTSNSSTAGGMVGVAPNAKIVPVRVIGPCGANLTDVADAIRWAAGGIVANVPVNANPAKIINVSLEAPGATCSKTLSDAIAFANSKGAVVVVPAGNSKKLEGDLADLTMPANCFAAITVGAIKENGAKADYSNKGAFVDVSAPGQNIIVASFESNGSPNYVTESGTSFAAAHASGVLALMYAAKPELTMGAATNFLKLHVAPIPQFANAKLKASGTGLVDASMAIEAVTHVSTFVPRNDIEGVGASQIVWKNKLTNDYELSRLYFESDAESDSILITEPEPIAVVIPSTDTLLGFGKFSSSTPQVFTRRSTSASVKDQVTDITNLNPIPNLMSVSKNYNSLGIGNFYKDANYEFAYRDPTRNVLILRKLLDTPSSTVNYEKAVQEKTISVSKDLAYIGAADFNSDGYTDTLWRHRATGVVKVLFTSENVVIWQNVYTLKNNQVMNESVFGTGDFVGDSAADIVVRDSINGVIKMISFTSNGTISITRSENYLPLTGAEIIKVGDFNGDKKDEFLVFDNMGQLTPWYVSSFSFDPSSHLLNPATLQNSIQFNQYNGNGTLNVAHYRPF